MFPHSLQGWCMKQKVTQETDLLEKYCDNLIIWRLCYQTEIFAGRNPTCRSVCGSLNNEVKKKGHNGDGVFWENIEQF